MQSGSRRGSSRRVGDNTATTNSSSASSPNGGSGGQSAGGGGATGRGPVPSSTSSSQATTPDEVVGDFLNQVCNKFISEFRLLDFYFFVCVLYGRALLLKTESQRPQLKQAYLERNFRLSQFFFSSAHSSKGKRALVIKQQQRIIFQENRKSRFRKQKNISNLFCG